MIRLIIKLICILTLIIGIGYLPGTYAVHTTTPVDLGTPMLLAAADQTDKASGDEKGEKKEDEVPATGVDRIASSVCYG